MSDEAERITAYLSGGGLFNPELADHEAVRDLLIDCRAALTAAPAHPDTEVEQLRREIVGLRAALAPFANYEKMRSTMGGTTPKAGVIWGCESKYGIAEITAEDMRAAIAALAGTAPVSQEYAELPKNRCITGTYLLSEEDARAFADATHALRTGGKPC